MDHHEYTRRIGRLDAEASILKEILQLCNSRSRMITERRRSEGETLEERQRIRVQIGSEWKREYKEMANAHFRLGQYYNKIGSWKNERARDMESESEGVTERDRLIELFHDAGRRHEELSQQLAELTDRQIIEKLDADVDDYAELVVELKRSLEQAGVETNENDGTWKPAPEIFRPSTKKRETEKSETVGSFRKFLIVDEFGRPLNEPVKEPGEEVRKNTARIVFNDGRKIVFAPPEKVQENVQEFKTLSVEPQPYKQADGYVTMAGQSSQSSSEQLPRKGGRTRRQPRTSSDARSAGEMQGNGAELAVMDALRRREYSGKHISKSVQTLRHIGTKAVGHLVRSQRHTRPTVLDGAPTASKRQDDGQRLNGCQRMWARLLVNSGGVLPLEHTTREVSAEKSSIESVEQQEAEEKKKSTKAVMKAAERSLLMPLLAAPTRETIKNDELRYKKSDATCDALLAALISGDPSTKPTPENQAKDGNDDV